MEAEFLSTYCISLSLFTGTAVIIIMYIKVNYNTNEKLPPGPRGFKALRDVLQAMREDRLDEVSEKWYHQYGELVLCRSVLGDMCILNSARLVRELYGKKELNDVTNNRPSSFLGWFIFFGFQDIATCDPHKKAEWMKLRKLFHYALKFYGDGVNKMESAVQDDLQRVMKELEDSNNDDIDIHSSLSDSIMRVVIALVTGEIPEPFLLHSAKQFDRNGNLLYGPITDFALTVCPWLRFVPFLPYRKICQDTIQARDDLLAEMFTKHKATHFSGQPRGIADVFFDEQEKEENQWMTDNNIRSLILDIIGAAYVTSTQTLQTVFLYLINYPEVERKIQKEIDSQLGQRVPSIQDRSNLPYTEAVVLEILRIASPVYMGLPHSITKDLTQDGHIIPKGTTVYANTLLFHNDVKVFGDPEMFRPDRFLDDRGQLLPATHPLRQSISPFGIGMRACPGEVFAKSRIFLYVTTLLQKFDILPPTKHELLPAQRSSFKYGIVLQVKPYYVTVRPRSQSSQGQWVKSESTRQSAC